MINSICDCLLQLLALAPFIWAARRSNENARKKTLILCALLFIITSVATDLSSNILQFKGQSWNWTGKIASLVIALIFIFSYRPLKPYQFGFTTTIETQNARGIFLICSGYALLRVVLYITMAKGPATYNIETILYQSTIPGITEEIIFRGILLTLLNQIFTKPRWAFANTAFGWAAIITSCLFGFTHGFYLDSAYHIQFNFFAIVRTAFDGFLFALLLHKTKSLIPSILLHNILNLIGNH